MGIEGVDSDNWYALFVSKATPAADIERLNKAVRRALETEAVKARLLSSGAEPAPSSPSELSSLLRSDMAKWTAVVRAKKIKPD
jgi:tripartite-type tricarboxylate transporter receptor subunit TctC